MKAIEGIKEKLSIHAGGTEEANDKANLADYIWMLKHEGCDADTAPIWEDILDILESLNRELNPLVSGSREMSQKEYQEFLVGPPRHLAYCANEMILQCTEYALYAKSDEATRRKLLDLGWRIATAWDGVLAGDFESIREHVDGQAWGHQE